MSLTALEFMQLEQCIISESFG